VICAVCYAIVEAKSHHCPRCGESSWRAAQPRDRGLAAFLPEAPPDCPSFAEFIEHGYPADQYPPSWCKPPRKAELAKRDAWVKRNPKPKAPETPAPNADQINAPGPVDVEVLVQPGPEGPAEHVIDVADTPVASEHLPDPVAAAADTSPHPNEGN
jgi:hypothetical protein